MWPSFIVRWCKSQCSRIYRLSQLCREFNARNLYTSFVRQTLTISPQNLDDKLLIEIGKELNLRELYILQNDYTPDTILPCSATAWQQFKSDIVRVNLCVDSIDAREVLLQPGAPVHTIWYRTTMSRVSEERWCLNRFWNVFNLFQMQPNTLRKVISMYKDTLRVFGYENLPKFHCPRQRSQRIDQTLIELVKGCRHLETLVNMIRKRLEIPDLM